MTRLTAPATNVKADPMMFLLSIFLTLRESWSSISALLLITPLSADGLRVGCCGIPIMTAVGPRDWFFSTGKINQTKTPVSPILMTMYDGIMSLPMRQWPSCTLIPAWGVAMHQTAIPPKHPMVMNMPAIHIMSCLRSRTTGKRAMCILSR
jgi:hypothetical protein